MIDDEQLMDDEQLAHLARAVRLDLREEERAALLGELREMLAFAGSLSEVKTGSVEEWRPEPPQGRPLRQDEPAPSLPQGVALGLAPESQEGYFRVPRTLDDA